MRENTKNRSLLHIVENEKIEQKYKKIATDISLEYRKFSNLHDLYELQNNEGYIYHCSLNDIEKYVSKREDIFHLQVWDTLSQEEVLSKLIDLWYEYSEYGNDNSYKKLGDIIKITWDGDTSLLINFWWDEIESLEKNRTNVTEYSFRSLHSFVENGDKNHLSLTELISEAEIFCILDSIEFSWKYRELCEILTHASFDILPQIHSGKKHIKLDITKPHIENLEDLKTILGLWKKSESKIFTKHSSTINPFLEQNSLGHTSVSETTTPLFTSFCYKSWKEKTLYYICDDILSKIFIKRRSKKQLSADLDLLLKISPWDYVVHIDHGVGIFHAISKKQLGEITKEYLEIHYKDDGKLFVPIHEVQRVSKYVWSENPPLTPLSWKVWEKKMTKVREDIREIAENILENFAERKLRSGKACVQDVKLIHDFWNSFPYDYTPDQSEAVENIFADMCSDKNMDRLIVGDVGFWKTEVAFNAAYLAYINKKQILLISPLVVLAHEHYNSAIERFSELGMNISVLTRLQSAAHATKVIQWFKNGEIDMIVGTHRLLSDKLRHKNLWLLVVDEEHKFWVVDKEKIKNLKKDIDILSLSATPIPRSLNLALSWVRDISLLKTPPKGRKSIETSVIEFNEALILESGKREFARGGQVFFVHNRVANIEVIKKKLEWLFPKKKVIITHWQLAGEELENRIIDFKEKKYDILLSTTVIENGIDFSNVNTIFINECQSFGISQIHQLRWRVWRSDSQGYCYLLYRKNNMWDEAAKRIQTIVDYSYLWAGFELAMKDLEIRWWWDILGIKQSGQSKEIGVTLFLKMLEDKITELKEERELNTHISKDSLHNKKRKHKPCQIELMIETKIADSYFLNEVDKIHFYRELELVEGIQELEEIWWNFFGNPKNIPHESMNLLALLKAQKLAKEFGVSKVKKIWNYYNLDFHPDIHIDELKKLLLQDKEIIFTVVSGTKLRANAKEFANDEIFLQYLLRIFEGKIGNPKIKLKKKT